MRLVTICHHTKFLQYYWLYSLCCMSYPCDLFILQLEVCTLLSSPILPMLRAGVPKVGLEPLTP